MISPARLILVASISLSSQPIAGPVLCWIPGGTPVCTAPGYQLQATIASDGEGGAFIAWADLRPGANDLDIYAQRIDSRGNPVWTPNGVPVCTAIGRQFSVIIGPDELGGAIVAWMDQRIGGADIFAQRIRADGEMFWGTDGSIVNVMPDFQIDPQPVMVPDEVGGAIFAWVDEVIDAEGELFPQRKTDIYAQRLAGSGGYMLWHPYGLPVCLSRGFQTDPVIVPDGAGGAIIGWVDGRSLFATDVYAQRVDPAGAMLWLENGAPICQRHSDQRGLASVSDGLGGAIFVWHDMSEGTYDIYASRVNGAGEPLWGVNGLPVAVLPGQQRHPVVCSDGAGGCIVAWADERQASYDIYAQRIDELGNARWPAQGVPICNFGFDQTDARIAADGMGGAIACWIDRSEDMPAVYAQRVDASGSLLWTIGGVAVCGVASGKYNLGIVPDGCTAGAIVAFVDHRAVETDIYAQRILGSGALVSTRLRSFAAAVEGSCVRLSWTLAEAVEDASFRVWRSEAPAGAAYALLEGDIEVAGLSFAFLDRAAEPARAYRYRVDVSEGGSSRALFETEPVAIPAAALALHQNHPNPFNPSTTIRFSLPAPGSVSLEVFDAAGALVRSLAAGIYPAGSHAVSWDGRDAAGARAPSGVYFCRLRAGTATRARTMILIR